MKKTLVIFDLIAPWFAFFMFCYFWPKMSKTLLYLTINICVEVMYIQVDALCACLDKTECLKLILHAKWITRWNYFYPSSIELYKILNGQVLPIQIDWLTFQKFKAGKCIIHLNWHKCFCTTVLLPNVYDKSRLTHINLKIMIKLGVYVMRDLLAIFSRL